MNRLCIYLCLVCAASGLLVAASPAGDAKRIKLAVTTTVENSGLAEVLLPAFTGKTGIHVDLVVAGTGAALKFAQRGDVDAVLVHARTQELAFLADGHASERRDVMYNHFIIAGPGDDPAGIRGMKDAASAFLHIRETRTQFVSRGDDSGTHAKEKSLWMAAGVIPGDLETSWYRQTGAGMGATLNVASGLGAYVLVDEATWSAFANKQALEALVSGDKRLVNQYGILLVNPERHPHVQIASAQSFMDWITSTEGQSVIRRYRVNGQQLFFPNYVPGP